MNLDQRVDPGDLEQPEYSGVDRDQAEATTGFLERTGRPDERADAGRVEERAAREIDDDHGRRRLREGFVEARRRCQVELAGDEHRFRTSGQRLAPNVKIARRGHFRRV